MPKHGKMDLMLGISSNLFGLFFKKCRFILSEYLQIHCRRRDERTLFTHGGYHPSYILCPLNLHGAIHWNAKITVSRWGL